MVSENVLGSKECHSISNYVMFTTEALVSDLQLDLASTTSIREFVRDFLRKKKKLSVLVNNAAVALNFSDLTRKTTSEGFELTMVTNYLGENVRAWSI